MSAAKGESPFGTCEWVSTRELAVVYGQTVDFWQKRAKAGAFESKRNGLGPRAHLSINVSSFLSLLEQPQVRSRSAMSKRDDFRLFQRAGTWYARKRRKGQEFETSLYTADKATGRERAKRWVERLIAEEWGEKPPRTFDEAMDALRRRTLRFPRGQDRQALRGLDRTPARAFPGDAARQDHSVNADGFRAQASTGSETCDRSPGSVLPVLHLRDGATLGVGRDEPRPAVPRGARQNGPHGRRSSRHAI